MTALVQGVDAEGKPINPDEKKNPFTIDGQDHATTSPNPNFDTTNLKRIDGCEVTRKKAGKVVQTFTNVVSKDGRRRPAR